MNLKTLLVCALLVGCLIIGFATAAGPIDDATTSQSIDGSVGPHLATISAPDSIPPWALSRGVKNELDVGPVIIKSTRPTPFQMTLEITGGFGGWGFIEPLYISTETPPVDESSWKNLNEGKVTIGPVSTTLSPHSVPVRLRQEVSSEDDGVKTLVITYTLKVTNPSVTPTPIPTVPVTPEPTS